jgi:hypothetical protein
MAKKRRKVYRKTKTGWKELSPYLKRKAERERQEHAKPKRVPKPVLEADPIRIREHALRPMIREACRAGLVEAIEHCSNFWNVSNGYKKYIDQQIKLQSEALMAAVKTAIRDELLRTVARSKLRKKSTK